MGEVVDLHSRRTSRTTNSIENLARFADGTLCEAAVKARHHLSNEEWAALGDSDRLVELVEACKTTPDTHRRHQAGTGANRDRRRTADPRQNHARPNANERHRIDSVKTLDALASTGAEAAAAGATL